MYAFSGNKHIAAPCVVLVLVEFGVAMVDGSFIWKNELESSGVRPWSQAGVTLGLATDTLICGASLWYMWKQGQLVKGFRQNTDLVRGLISLFLVIFAKGEF